MAYSRRGQKRLVEREVTLPRRLSSLFEIVSLLILGRCGAYQFLNHLRCVQMNNSSCTYSYTVPIIHIHSLKRSLPSSDFSLFSQKRTHTTGVGWGVYCCVCEKIKTLVFCYPPEPTLPPSFNSVHHLRTAPSFFY